MQLILSPITSLTIYKSSVRRYFNYADVIYDQHSNALFSKRIGSVQYNETIAGVVRGSPIEKFTKSYDWSIIFKEDRWDDCACFKNFFSAGNPSCIERNSWSSFLQLNIFRIRWFLESLMNGQKQPPEVFCEKSCFQNPCKFNRKTAVLESVFNK